MGQKRLKGIPVLYGELKKTRGLDLTDTAWEAIAAIAKEKGLSKSELVEQWARGLRRTPPLQITEKMP